MGANPVERTVVVPVAENLVYALKTSVNMGQEVLAVACFSIKLLAV